MAKAGSSILSLSGFDQILKKIDQAGGSIDNAVDVCMHKAGQILQKEQKAAMQKKKVASDLINRMGLPRIERNGNTVTARSGYKKGNYDPKNLSDGYKAVFINYGTPRVKPRKFIQAAKKQAKPQVMKEAEDTFNRILGDLKK